MSGQSLAPVAGCLVRSWRFASSYQSCSEPCSAFNFLHKNQQSDFE